MTYAVLDVWDVVLAAALLAINAGVSIAFRLGLERPLLVAGLRTVVQLALIGLVLKFIFAQQSPLWTAALAIVMVLAAGHEVLTRQEYRFEGPAMFGLGTGTLLFVGIFVTSFAVAGVIGPEPWYAPRYVLPILGMVLGNAMTAVSLVLEQMTRAAMRERPQIEAQLAQGASRFTALAPPLGRALKTGMMPILNAMAASGIVALPGMMTGQILAGVDPVEATKYQIVIMFVIAGATALAVALAGLGSVVLLTDERHRLRTDRLRAKR
jgi:putative ABC transport system permease protein